MNTLRLFFNHHPALFFALSAIGGISASLEGSFHFFWISCLPTIPYLLKGEWKRPLTSYFFAATLFLLCPFPFTPFEIPAKGVKGYAKIHIESVSQQSFHHQKGWVYKGTILHFFGERQWKKGKYPFFLALKEPLEERPKADSDYLVKGQILPGKGKRFIIKSNPHTLWEPLENTFSFAEMRFQAKQKVKYWIESYYSSPPASLLLVGLLIGEFDDAELKRDFGRFGLLHLLAISGFHFSVLAGLFNRFFRLFFSERQVSVLLIALLSAYFFFLGWGPSVVRAWMTIAFFYGACLNKRQSRPLNSLGAAVLLAILIDPLLLENLGFQFSALTTAAILLFYAPSFQLLTQFFPNRPLKSVLEWPVFDRYAYLILSFFKSSGALTLATTWIALPLSLYYFQFFPLLSLIYNLFFPFLVSISMNLLIFGLIFSFFPPLAKTIHTINDFFTSFFLNLTYDMPPSWDWVILAPVHPPLFTIILIAFLLLISIYFQKSEKQLKCAIEI